MHALSSVVFAALAAIGSSVVLAARVTSQDTKRPYRNVSGGELPVDTTVWLRA